jgi:hypothetical protein
MIAAVRASHALCEPIEPPSAQGAQLWSILHRRHSIPERRIAEQARPLRPSERAQQAYDRQPRSRGPYYLALPIGSASCSSASRTNRRLFNFLYRRIQEHDHTGAAASCALFIVRSLLGLFGVNIRSRRARFCTWRALAIFNFSHAEP